MQPAGLGVRTASRWKDPRSPRWQAGLNLCARSQSQGQRREPEQGREGGHRNRSQPHRCPDDRCFDCRFPLGSQRNGWATGRANSQLLNHVGIESRRILESEPNAHQASATVPRAARSTRTRGKVEAQKHRARSNDRKPGQSRSTKATRTSVLGWRCRRSSVPRASYTSRQLGVEAKLSGVRGASNVVWLEGRSKRREVRSAPAEAVS